MRMLQPEMLWCAIICGQDQRRFLLDVREMTAVFPALAERKLLEIGISAWVR